MKTGTFSYPGKCGIIYTSFYCEFYEIIKSVAPVAEEFYKTARERKLDSAFVKVSNVILPAVVRWDFLNFSFNRILKFITENILKLVFS